MVAVVGLLGTYTAVWLQQVSIQFAPVAIAQTLLSTSPLFILPIIALRGEKLSFRAVGGVVVSLVGNHSSILISKHLSILTMPGSSPTIN